VNLELWHKVEKTNPEYTKKANVRGNKITSIAPQYQIKQATEQFGPYGITWGFRDLTIDHELVSIGLVTLKAVFYYPNGDFPIINSISLYTDNAKTKIDHDFAKKIETDTLTKALSKLGFNADIFLGRFDDTKYVEDMEKEFASIPTDEEKATFLMYKENQDAIRFFLFARHLGDEKYTNLYNSAPKDKMKFKKACDELEKQGAKDSIEVVDTVKGHLDNNDPAWKEELEGLEPCEKQVLWKLFDEKTQKLMQNFKG